MNEEMSVLSAIALIAVLVPVSLALVLLVDTMGHYIGVMIERASPRMRGITFATRMASMILANVVLLCLLIYRMRGA